MTENRREWHLDKSVSVGHVLTTLTIALAGAMWLTTTEGRLSDIETSARYNEKRLSQVEKTQVNQAEWIAGKLEQIRLEQREDIRVLTKQINEGFLRIERRFGKKADK